MVVWPRSAGFPSKLYPPNAEEKRGKKRKDERGNKRSETPLWPPLPEHPYRPTSTPQTTHMHNLKCILHMKTVHHYLTSTATRLIKIKLKFLRNLTRDRHRHAFNKPKLWPFLWIRSLKCFQEIILMGLASITVKVWPLTCIQHHCTFMWYL